MKQPRSITEIYEFAQDLNGRGYLTVDEWSSLVNELIDQHNDAEDLLYHMAEVLLEVREVLIDEADDDLLFSIDGLLMDYGAFPEAEGDGGDDPAEDPWRLSDELLCYAFDADPEDEDFLEFTMGQLNLTKRVRDFLREQVEGSDG